MTRRRKASHRHRPRPESLEELLALPRRQIQRVDIARMNLLAASDLPGSERLDVPHCLARLNEWAALANREIKRHLYRATDPRYAEHYRHSKTYLRAEMLAQTLSEQCGVHYNRHRIRDVNFGNARDLFIHGMIDDDNGGTCASMPVLYISVGRRLGFPIKLICTKAHMFSRWQSPGRTHRFNIEVSGDGIGCSPDDYYRTWPHRWTPRDHLDPRLLAPLTGLQELAEFLSCRGHCLMDHHRPAAAAEAYAAACELAPEFDIHRAWCRQALHRASQSPHPGRPQPTDVPGLPTPPRLPSPRLWPCNKGRPPTRNCRGP